MSIDIHNPPHAVEEHSSILADWAIVPCAAGFVVRERAGAAVMEFGPFADEAAAESLIADRRERMEEQLEAMVRLSRVSHH